MGFFHPFTKNKKKPLIGAQLSDSLYASLDPEVNILYQEKKKERQAEKQQSQQKMHSFF